MHLLYSSIGILLTLLVGIVPILHAMAADLPSSSFQNLYGRAVISQYHEQLGLSRRAPAPPMPKVAESQLPIGILGAGVSGLYTAMILESLDIPYQIIEASSHVGGRLYTYKFPDGSTYDYYDVGAMRYPNTTYMKRTFDLFEQLNLPVVNYTFTAPNTFLYYNGQRYQRPASGAAPDPAQDVFAVGQYVGQSFVSEGYQDILCTALQPFRQALVANFTSGYNNLMQSDYHSMRSYMLSEGYTSDVINWVETMDKSTGWYDRGLSDTVFESLAFDYPESGTVSCPPEATTVDWHAIDGGSSVITNTMLTNLKNASITYNHRVSAISSNDDGSLSVTAAGDVFNFSHVISSIPIPALSIVDLSGLDLPWPVTSALRELQYSPSTKIGIKFTKNWWYDMFQIDGGQSLTDLPLRTVVYPSYGPAPTRSNVLIVSYCWTQDALRMGSLMGSDAADQKTLIDLIMSDLEVLHGVEAGTISQYYDGSSIYPFNWYSDSLTGGAFAFFGPGQFKSVYPWVTQVAAGGRLHFIGEATSASHAWVLGSLNSAWRGVYEVLVLNNATQPTFDKFFELWGHNDEWDEEVLKRHIIAALGS